MKHSARVMSLLMALSGVVLAQTPARQHHPRKRHQRKHHRRRHRPNQRAPTLKLRVRQRVPQSEPWAGTRPRARSSEQAIAVVSRGERNERPSDTKGTGVRLYHDERTSGVKWLSKRARPPFLA